MFWAGQKFASQSRFRPHFRSCGKARWALYRLGPKKPRLQTGTLLIGSTRARQWMTRPPSRNVLIFRNWQTLRSQNLVHSLFIWSYSCMHTKPESARPAIRFPSSILTFLLLFLVFGPQIALGNVVAEWAYTLRAYRLQKPCHYPASNTIFWHSRPSCIHFLTAHASLSTFGFQYEEDLGPSHRRK